MELSLGCYNSILHQLFLFELITLFADWDWNLGPVSKKFVFILLSGAFVVESFSTSVMRSHMSETTGHWYSPQQESIKWSKEANKSGIGGPL